MHQVDDVKSPLTASAPVGRVGGAVLLANVVAEVGIVVTGGLVRLTGSGLGCPTWPECSSGNLVPTPTRSEGLHTFIEFGNRMLTFAVLVAAVSALVVVLRPWLAGRFPDVSALGPPGRVRRPLVWLAAAGILGIVAQAALGGITVLLDLHPATVAAHFLLSMAMIAVAFVLFWRAREPGDHPVQVTVRRELRQLSWVIAGLAAVVLMLGAVVTGSGPHSGDADVVSRFDLDVRMMSWLHADVVLEVRCAALDDDTKGNDRVARLEQVRRTERQLEGAGYPEQWHVGDRHLVQGAKCSGDQAVHDRGVPARGHHSDAQPGAGHRNRGRTRSAHEVPPS